MSQNLTLNLRSQIFEEVSYNLKVNPPETRTPNEKKALEYIIGFCQTAIQKKNAFSPSDVKIIQFFNKVLIERIEVVCKYKFSRVSVEMSMLRLHSSLALLSKMGKVKEAVLQHLEDKKEEKKIDPEALAQLTKQKKSESELLENWAKNPKTLLMFRL